MTVSRKGKRGKIKMRPFSRNKRVVSNALRKNTTHLVDLRPTQKKISKEQWVLDFVLTCVGTPKGKDFVAADDTASDILMKLIDQRGLSWDQDRIETFCKAEVRKMLFLHFRKKEKGECEYDLGEGGLSILEIDRYQDPTQEIMIMAHQGYGLIKAIPTSHQQVLEILCDGGNPIDIAQELAISPHQAIAMINEARLYITLVDPL